eukprot:362938-Chlamydomonas_euryale.AAC.5
MQLQVHTCFAKPSFASCALQMYAWPWKGFRCRDFEKGRKATSPHMLCKTNFCKLCTANVCVACREQEATDVIKAGCRNLFFCSFHQCAVSSGLTYVCARGRGGANVRRCNENPLQKDPSGIPPRHFEMRSATPHKPGIPNLPD